MFKNTIQKVWKSAVAYIVGSIAFIQLAPVFFATFPPEELFGTSAEEIMPILFIVVAIGFPIVIASSFYVNRQQVNKTKKPKDVCEIILAKSNLFFLRAFAISIKEEMIKNRALIIIKLDKSE